MKKFITFTLCLLLCIAPLGLTACGDKKSEKVDTSVASVGNGGMVVTRGNYVYFVNGYKGYSTYTKDNLNKKFEVGGLYRAKLNEASELTYDENGSVVGAERISSRLAGFESTSLYVFGNHIYFASPITEVNKDGELQTNKLEFSRVEIGGGKTQRIYQSKVAAENVKFEFYYAEGKVYLMINENSTLKRINCFGKFKKSTVAENVATVVLPRDTDDVFESKSYKNIYYTKTEDGKVVIYNYNIATNRTEYKKTTDYKTCELIDYKFDHLYYKASREDYPGYTYYYRMAANKNAITNLAEVKLTRNGDYTDFYLLENEVSGYIAQTSDKTWYIDGNGEAYPVVEEKLDIIAIKNNYIYFNSSNTIKRINYYNLPSDKTQETVLQLDGLQAHDYDVDFNNLYVYATSGSNTYLYSIMVGNIVGDEEFEAKLLGVYQNGDAPEIEDEE